MKQTKLFDKTEKPILKEIPLKTALELGEHIRFLVSEWMDRAEVVGSARRQKPYCHDVDIVGIAKPEQFEKAIKNIQREFKVHFKENGVKVKKLYVEYQEYRVQIDLYCATTQNYGLTKIIRTGSAEHNMWLNNYARSKGFRVKYAEGLTKDGVAVAGETEESVFKALDLEVPKPEEREVNDRKPKWMH